MKYNYCIVLYCIVLYCIVLSYIVLDMIERSIALKSELDKYLYHYIKIISNLLDIKHQLMRNIQI